jgi:OPA family glycerol-3-phosphate transporter-like MFS transporter
MSSVLAYVTPIIILKTFELDWRWIFRLPVLLLLAGGVAYYLIVRNRPEDLGFEPPEETSETEKGTKQVDEKESSLSRYMTALKNWRFMVACVGIGFQSAARYGLIYWVPVYFLGENLEKSGSLWIAVALPIGMAFGAVTGGWVSDKVFNSVRWKVITLFMTLAAAASMIMYALPREHWAGIVMLFTCGFFVYGSQSAFWALAPDLLGSKRTGTGVGILDFFAYLFAGIVSPLIGFIIENFNDNTALVFPVVAAASIASAITGLFIRR